MGEQYYGSLKVEIIPRTSWNNRTGYAKERTFSGEYNSLLKTYNDLYASATEKAAGLVNLELSKPDPSGHSILTATYLEDQTYQWTLQSNTIENSVYLHPKYYAMMKSLAVNEVSQSVKYNVMINGIELGKTKGMMLGELVTYVPKTSKELSSTESSSLSRFQYLWPTLTAPQQDSASALYVIRSRNQDTYNTNQVVLRKQTLLANWDVNANPFVPNTAPLFTELVDSMMTKEFINQWFAQSTPIPTSIYSALQSNYYLYVGPIVEQQNTGKLLVTQEFWYVPQYEQNIYGTPYVYP
jgi:hypothetical protein